VSIFEKEQAEREKATRRPYTPQELLKIRARRQFSNAGSRLGPIPIEEHWGMIKDETGGPSFDQTTLQEILADALFCDAKYTYSHTLCLRLAAAPTFWTRIS
jgi:hypothetical protein